MRKKTANLPFRAKAWRIVLVASLILTLQAQGLWAAAGINATVSDPTPNPVLVGYQNTYYATATLTGTTSQNEAPVAKSWQWTVVSVTYQGGGEQPPVTIPMTASGGGVYSGSDTTSPQTLGSYLSCTVVVASPSEQNPTLTGTFNQPGTWTVNLTVTATY